VRPGTERGGLLRPLAERDFRLLWAGQAISLLGDGVLTVALAWQTLQLSSSPTALALVMFARATPRIVLMLLGGVISVPTSVAGLLWPGVRDPDREAA
jgi:Transmembrane secretion effector